MKDRIENSVNLSWCLLGKVGVSLTEWSNKSRAPDNDNRVRLAASSELLRKCNKELLRMFSIPNRDLRHHRSRCWTSQQRQADNRYRRRFALLQRAHLPPRNAGKNGEPGTTSEQSSPG
jgi:hypothetical protein